MSRALVSSAWLASAVVLGCSLHSGPGTDPDQITHPDAGPGGTGSGGNDASSQASSGGAGSSSGGGSSGGPINPYADAGTGQGRDGGFNGTDSGSTIPDGGGNGLDGSSPPDGGSWCSSLSQCCANKPDPMRTNCQNMLMTGPTESQCQSAYKTLNCP